MTAAGTLYVVATPLGNLEDITLRALRILREVDAIAAEDTRHSRKLLDHYGISKPLISYYDEVERRRAPELVARIQRGESIALISDAGTPCIADPGYRLVNAAIDAGVAVVAIPGASAVAASLSVAGLPTDRFVFEGFVPAKPVARRKFYAGLIDETRTTVVYEAARRLTASLADLLATLGDRRIAMVRELSKMYEEVLRGTASSLHTTLTERERVQGLQGELTMLIGGASATAEEIAPEELAQAIAKLRAEGKSLKEASQILSRETGIPRREIYKRGLE
ncbi:MAG TPA: 16S rRNA (cytidine(1402)-2'-O)-methyltransferase [Terriglobales bacterium]|nr:16S rRNA (cytidine(1402)-2'-O)-methyltransferase [Terriglobales bacterium]